MQSSQSTQPPSLRKAAAPTIAVSTVVILAFTLLGWLLLTRSAKQARVIDHDPPKVHVQPPRPTTVAQRPMAIARAVPSESEPDPVAAEDDLVDEEESPQPEGFEVPIEDRRLDEHPTSAQGAVTKSPEPPRASLDAEPRTPDDPRDFEIPAEPSR